MLYNINQLFYDIIISYNISCMIRKPRLHRFCGIVDCCSETAYSYHHFDTYQTIFDIKSMKGFPHTQCSSVMAFARNYVWYTDITLFYFVSGIYIHFKVISVILVVSLVCTEVYLYVYSQRRKAPTMHVIHRTVLRAPISFPNQSSLGLSDCSCQSYNVYAPTQGLIRFQGSLSVFMNLHQFFFRPLKWGISWKNSMDMYPCMIYKHLCFQRSSNKGKYVFNISINIGSCLFIICQELIYVYLVWSL